MNLGANFEREIREQPEVWERVAHSAAAQSLASSLVDDVLLVGSGSSLFAGQLGAIALRRRGIVANAVAATEVPGDYAAYEGRNVVAISQSGRSSDLLNALDRLNARTVVALTNAPESPLARRASRTIDVLAGTERAIPASKSVSATVAILLIAASLAVDDGKRTAQGLTVAARAVGSWLDADTESLRAPTERIARVNSVALLGTEYGVPIAREAALKFKEAAYVHAEGFEAGEFRHGSVAVLDAGSQAIGIVDADGLPIVGPAMRDATARGAAGLLVGTVEFEGLPRVGPLMPDAFDALGWLVTAQMLALYTARERGIDSDAPRGLRKAIDGGMRSVSE